MMSSGIGCNALIVKLIDWLNAMRLLMCSVLSEASSVGVPGCV